MNSLIRQIATSLKEDDTDTNRKKWADYIIKNNIAIMDLVGLLDFEKHVAMRFIWLIGGLCESNPKIVYPAVSYFYSKRDNIQIPNYNRSLAKMFWLCGIPDDMEGEAIDEMFKWLLDADVIVSTKNYSLLAIHNLTDKHPELKNELKIVIENQMNRNSKSFEQCAKKILKKLE